MCIKYKKFLLNAAIWKCASLVRERGRWRVRERERKLCHMKVCQKAGITAPCEFAVWLCYLALLFVVITAGHTQRGDVTTHLALEPLEPAERHHHHHHKADATLNPHALCGK